MVAACGTLFGVLERGSACLGRGLLGGGFRVEDASEAGPGELNADDALAFAWRAADMDNAALCREIRLFAAWRVVRKRNANLQIGADGEIESSDKGSSAAA